MRISYQGKVPHERRTLSEEKRSTRCDGCNKLIVDFGLARLAEDSAPRPSTGASSGSGPTLPHAQASRSGQAAASEPPPAPPAEVRLDGIEVNAEDTTLIAGTAATIRVHAPGAAQEESKALLGDKPSLAGAGRILGTVRYIAPEIFTGAAASRASDIYAFGVLTFEVLVGRAPFEGATGQVIIDHVKTDPPVPSTLSASVPSELDAALLAALQKDPASRPARATDVVKAIRGAWQRVALRDWKAREIPRRAGISVVVGLAVALAGALAGNFGPLQRAESWTIDSRFAWRPARPPDPRLVLVVLDDETLAAEQATLTDRADEFGGAIQRIFAAGARAVAVDILFPARWSRSKPFADAIVKHADRLTLGALSTPQGKLVGPEAISPLVTVVLGPKGVSELFGYVNLDPDSDGILRRARASYTDQAGRERDAFPGRAVRTLHEPIPAAARTSFIIDGSIDGTGYPRVSWKDLPTRVDKEPEWFRDRLVLVGAKFSGAGDVHRVPNTEGHPREVSGVTVQALIVDTLLAGLPIREVGQGLTFFCLAPCLILVVMAFLCHRGGSVPAVLSIALAGIYLVSAVVLFSWHGLLFPLVAPLTAVLVTVAVAWALRRRLSPFPGGAS